MESFSFHFVFLGKAKLSEVALKLASAQTRSESAKAQTKKYQTKVPSNWHQCKPFKFDHQFKSSQKANTIVIVDAKKSIMVMGRYMRL